MKSAGLEGNKVLVGLGSNMDHPEYQINAAIKAINDLSSIRILAQSSLYRSTPQGPQDQGNFCNAVILIDTHLAPVALLKKLQAIEISHGRIKTRHWGERVIDLDILFYGTQVINLENPDLCIPHRHALTRDFVVIPALEIAPHWILPDGSRLGDHKDQCINHQLALIG